MGLKKVVSTQYKRIADQAAITLSHVAMPREGWVRTVRKSLGMSGAQLAKRLGITRALVARNEQAELDHNITLKTINNMAKAMGCRFVYAIVPEKSIDDLIYQQALLKAKALVDKTNVHMALEKQLLSEQDIQAEIERLALEIINENHRDLWD